MTLNPFDCMASQEELPVSDNPLMSGDSNFLIEFTVWSEATGV